MVPQQILLGAAFGQAGAPPRRRARAPPPFAPGRGEGIGADRVFREGVEQGAMRRRVQQAALLALALDLDERVAEFAQQPDAGRLVIDKGAAAAVGGNQPAQHDRAGEVGADPGLAQDRQGRVIVGDGELGDDRGLLGPRAHEAGIGPLAERQPERVEQDRFAGPGLAGQHAQPGRNARVRRSIRTMSRIVNPSSIRGRLL